MTEDVRAVTVSALAADGALVTTPHVAEEIAAAGLSEIQLAFDNATALLAVISQDWEKSAAETLEPKPASPTEPSAVSVPVASQAAGLSSTSSTRNGSVWTSGCAGD